MFFGTSYINVEAFLGWPWSQLNGGCRRFFAENVATNPPDQAPLVLRCRFHRVCFNTSKILVGGLEPWNFMTFHSVGKNNPNWFSYFFRGVGIPPTRIQYGFQEHTWLYQQKSVWPVNPGGSPITSCLPHHLGFVEEESSFPTRSSHHLQDGAP